MFFLGGLGEEEDPADDRESAMSRTIVVLKFMAVELIPPVGVDQQSRDDDSQRQADGEDAEACARSRTQRGTLILDSGDLQHVRADGQHGILVGEPENAVDGRIRRCRGFGTMGRSCSLLHAHASGKSTSSLTGVKSELPTTTRRGAVGFFAMPLRA